MLLTALQLAHASWGEGLRRATPAVGIAVIVASIALAVYDVAEGIGEAFWRPAKDLFFT